MSLGAPAAREKSVASSLDDPIDRMRELPWSNRSLIEFTGLQVAIGLTLFAAVWLSVLAFTSLSPPADNIEQLTWVRSLEWGYYKHPPLPTWLLWLPVKVFGLSAWASYGVGAVMTGS